MNGMKENQFWGIIHPSRTLSLGSSNHWAKTLAFWQGGDGILSFATIRAETLETLCHSGVREDVIDDGAETVNGEEQVNSRDRTVMVALCHGGVGEDVIDDGAETGNGEGQDNNRALTVMAGVTIRAER
nr:hypothetical protein Itr_chr15CG08490 [Ipomoea trifida]